MYILFTFVYCNASFFLTDSKHAYSQKYLQNSKLKKTVEQINHLESKLQCANNENAKLKMKQKEDAKLWKGLDSKLSSTKTLCNQLTDTLQHLAGQTSEGKELLMISI